MSKNRNNTSYTYEQLFRLALDNYQGSILIIDYEGKIIYCNDGSGRMLDISKSWLESQTMYTVIKAGLAKSSAGLEALEKKVPIQKYIQNQHGDGMFLYSHPIIDNSNNVEFVITYSQDEEFMGNYLKWMKQEKSKMESGMKYITNKKYFPVVAQSPLMKKVLTFGAQVASSSSTISLYGESGVGKEVLALHIHSNSKRSDNIFLPVNCAAIPHELVESEFFGYEKGAFTGARTDGKPGLFEIANNGTIFLDEIGDLPLSLQAKLLRVIETREVRRIGGNQNYKIDVRIICATNRNLKELVENNTFREDLYYRINVVPIKIPPLRERQEDILPLAEFFLMKYNRKNGCNTSLSPEDIKKLQNYSWPGNVRELRNAIERLVIASQTELPLNLFNEADFMTSPIPINSSEINQKIEDSLKDALKKYEIQYIKAAYEQCEYNAEKTANLLGIHRSGLYKKLEEFKLLRKK